MNVSFCENDRYKRFYCILLIISEQCFLGTRKKHAEALTNLL